MRIGILTFQFAYNYGAMLQAYALKSYIQNLGHEVTVLPYYPLHFQSGYSNSPFVRNISLKHRIYNVLHYLRKRPQARLFEQFKREYLYNRDVQELERGEDIAKQFQMLDGVVYGSDQIWNDAITREDPFYFGALINARKISYAASMGTKEGTKKQIEFIRRYLPGFYKLSVREPESKKIIAEEIQNEPEVVCDPVFLKTKEEWKKIEKVIDIQRPYLLVYMLQKNEALLSIARKYAQQEELELYEIHPNLYMHHQGTRLLKKVGPREFLYLVDHAGCICTNSFHCVSFSIIFRKMLLHMPNSNSPERTVSILKRAGVKVSDAGCIKVDLKKQGDAELNDFIVQSKRFLDTALN